MEETRKRAIEELKKADSFIAMTENSCALVGRGLNILTMFGCLVNQLKDKFGKETLEEVFKMSLEHETNKKNQTKDLEKTLDELNKILKKIVED